MKLLTYHQKNTESVGVLNKNGDLIIPIKALGLTYPSMHELILHVTEDELNLLRNAAKDPSIDGIPYATVGKVAPIPEPRQDVICLGYNYLDHIDESARFKGEDVDLPEYAIYFSKRVNRAVPDGGEITSYPELDEQLDYETELAVIIGKDAKDVPAERVGEYIFGYTILNDVSARKLQGRHRQFYFGKSLDGFTPMGPWIVTGDEFNFPLDLGVSTYVNGELRQNARTSQMIFKIPHVIAELSSGFTLKAGTIIATGTPGGVGMGDDTPRFLQKGDVVECVVEGVGKLTNVVG